MESKPFKTLDEQIEILKSRGLIINDENFARDFLLKNNYYRTIHFRTIQYAILTETGSVTGIIQSPIL